jgi:hypothetical protein
MSVRTRVNRVNEGENRLMREPKVAAAAIYGQKNPWHARRGRPSAVSNSLDVVSSRRQRTQRMLKIDARLLMEGKQNGDGWLSQTSPGICKRSVRQGPHRNIVHVLPLLSLPIPALLKPPKAATDSAKMEAPTALSLFKE